jgi:hypothetical protein
MTLRRLIIAIVVMAMTIPLTLSTAWASDVAQGGRRTPPASYYDGTSARIDGILFLPANHSCLIYSVLVYDETDPRQLETGSVRCLNWSIDKYMHQSKVCRDL